MQLVLDVRQTFENCLSYNAEQSCVSRQAAILSQLFEEAYNKRLQRLFTPEQRKLLQAALAAMRAWRAADLPSARKKRREF